jgi:hypothetical protein
VIARRENQSPWPLSSWVRPYSPLSSSHSPFLLSHSQRDPPTGSSTNTKPAQSTSPTLLSQVPFLSLSLPPFSSLSTDYVGTDFFTFRLQMGSLSSAAATVAITVGDEEEGMRSGTGTGNGSSAHQNGNHRQGTTATAARSKPPSRRAPPQTTAAGESKEAVEMPSRAAKPPLRDKGDLL